MTFGRVGPQDEVVVIGAGGHAKVVVAAIRAAGAGVRGVFDDDEAKLGTEVLRVPVLGTVDDPELDGAAAVLGIGDNRTRRRLALALGARVRWFSVVHPTAWIDESAEIGKGTVVMAGAIVQPGVVLGDHTIVNTGATVDHDCRVGDFVHLAPGSHVAGNVRIGEGALLGIGCSALPDLTVGRWAVVGAGATLIEGVGDGETVVGTPARRPSRTAEERTDPR